MSTELSEIMSSEPRDIPVGSILPMTGNTDKPGILFADGREVETEEYPHLAEVMGAVGDTFKIPDFRRKVITAEAIDKTRTEIAHDAPAYGVTHLPMKAGNGKIYVGHIQMPAEKVGIIVNQILYRQEVANEV